MSIKKNDRVRNSVRENYSRVAKDSRVSCGCSPTCCGDARPTSAELTSLAMGYSAEDLNLISESANMGLGCGNPQTISELKTGEVVLETDLQKAFCYSSEQSHQITEAGLCITFNNTLLYFSGSADAPSSAKSLYVVKMVSAYNYRQPPQLSISN